MRNRLQVHFKALTFSLSAVGSILFLAFFFYDGPLDIAFTGPVALAKETNALAPMAAPEPARNPLAGILPAGFQPQWRQVSLDGDRVRLNILKEPFLLSQTHHQAGGEAFQYASYLFEQMSHSVSSPKVAEGLKSLSLRAQTMGQAISQANEFQFAGPPTTDMSHLQVRSAILRYVSGLNPRPLVNVQYNEKGKVLALSTSTGINGGEDIDAFMAQVNTLTQQPEAQAYPQVMQLVQQEGALLKNLANHMTLRWESTQDCPKDCGNVSVYLRVYAHQTLPGKTLAAVTR
jgi:hypothetical protein